MTEFMKIHVYKCKQFNTFYELKGYDLFVFIPYSRFFHSYINVIIAGEGLQILTYTRCSWLLTSEGSLACHTYGDTGHPFITVNSEYPWHLHLLPNVQQWSCPYLSLRLMYVAAGIRTPIGNLPLAVQRSNPLRHRPLAIECNVMV